MNSDAPVKNYRVTFHPLDDKLMKFNCKIYAASSKRHAVNILKKKRKSNGLAIPIIRKVREVCC